MGLEFHSAVRMDRTAFKVRQECFALAPMLKGVSGLLPPSPESPGTRGYAHLGPMALLLLVPTLGIQDSKMSCPVAPTLFPG